MKDADDSLFEALTVIEKKELKGSNYALVSESEVYVSPAMFKLLKQEEGEDFDHLIDNLSVVNLGSDPFDSEFSPPFIT